MQPGVSVGGTNDPNLPKSVTRVLQHSILQLCNEHISYNHTLQVLGVLCLTIDDKQQELVVKVNNTLKRVNPVTPPKDPLPFPPTGVTRADPDQCLLPTTATELMYGEGGGCPNGAFSSLPGRSWERRKHGTQGELLSLASGGRKGHGRKQTNPVRVKHVYDEAEGDISDGDVLTIEPTHPPESPDTQDRGTQDLGTQDRRTPDAVTSRGESVSHSKSLGGIRKAKRKLNDLFVSPSGDRVDGNTRPNSSNNQGSDGAYPGVCGEDLSGKRSPNRSTATRPVMCDDSGEDSHSSSCSRRLVVIAPDEASSPENVDDLGTPNTEVGALNFSMGALNGGTPQAPKNDGAAGTIGGGIGGGGGGLAIASLSAMDFATGLLPNDLNGIRIKEEIKSYYPLGFDLLMNANSFDVSQNLAIHTTFLDDRRYLPSTAHCSSSSLGGVTNGHIASQNALSAELCSTSRGCYLSDATSAAGGLLLDEARLRNMVNGLSVAQVAVGPASYTISSCLKDGLTMHLTKTRREKDRSLLGGSSMKVKDIIMYDDSAPLHTQKGNKIEGDFMLDSLNVEGKKRRRRTAEDALTSEEIAEYMGSCDRGPCSFKCKYCGEVCADLSRYFNHTLIKHNSFICHQCGKNFTTKSSLLRHRPIHTGMRRFACSICKKSFYRKDKCKAHIKRHLGIGSDPPEKYPPLPPSLTNA